MKKKIRPQLRTCTVCHKPGHNKARCPIFLSEQKNIELANQPAVKMILHESKRRVKSPHVIDLKPKQNFWSEIATFSPEILPEQQRSTSKMMQKNKPLKKLVGFSIKNALGFSNIITRFEAWHDNRTAQKEIARIEKKIFKSVSGEKVEQENTEIEDKIKENIAPSPPKDEKDGTSCENTILSDCTQKPQADPETTSIADSNEVDNHPKIPLKNIIWRLSWKTAIIIFICIIPFQAHSYYQSVKITTGKIAAEGTEGFMALQESTAAILSADLANAEDSVAEALNKFQNAIQAMDENHRLLQKIVSVVPIVSNEVQSRQKLITAGQKIALGNQYLIQGIDASQHNSAELLTNRIEALTGYLKAAIPNYDAALEDISSVDDGILPFEYQAAFKDFRLLFAAFIDDLHNLVDLGQIVGEVFGGNGYRRYLIIFQNPHEIRPTGGFMGSYALIDIKDGKIVSLDIPPGGSYALQGQLDALVEPPIPLLLTNKRWEFQDANWFPDFPASAEKMLWFYRHSRQITADGVIAVNSTVLERLIAVLGPMVDEKRSLVLTSSTAIYEIQKIVEEGPEKADNKPKQILADLAPKIISYLYNAESKKTMPLIVNLAEALENKEIQAYFIDPKTEKTISSFGWGGQILPVKSGQDYLMVVNTNIQGQKTDAQIKQAISHQVVVSDDGSITDTVVITREHTGLPGQNLYGSANINYMRVYVPKGSELISAGGFTWPDERKFRAPIAGSRKDDFLLQNEKEIKIDDRTGTRITEEFGKTVFGNWMILEPGDIGQVQFTYRLPFKIDISGTAGQINKNLFKKIISDGYISSRYQLIVQKQSGVKSTIESQIIYPAPWHPNWTEGQNITLAGNGISIGPMNFTSDKIWSLLMRKENNI